ncbi:hypothetical protein VNO78_06446 [Psophocarpus tetragonolobus]|uniref:Uncharacterized protein n=1 Tax=Psophocarpus tetragonolobus TaxID=3891 RepID=A0AAN9XR58_PSOTE
MAKLSFAQMFSFILIIFVISQTSEALAPKRCQKMIQPTNCIIAKCQSDCFSMYKQFRGVGVCVGSGSTGNYACVCIYDCFANKLEHESTLG